jgi:site-specific recombinase XerD
MVSLRPRNGKWHISYYLNGRRVQKSTKIPLAQKALAESYKKKIEIELAQGILGWGDSNLVSILDAGNKWINSLKARNAAPASIVRYHRIVKSFLDFWGEEYPEMRAMSDINAERMQEYISFYAIGHHPNTIRGDAKVLSTWFNFCIRMDWIQSNPVNKIDLPKRIEAHIRYFSSDEVRRIFEVSGSRRDLWEFLYRTGSRIGETSRMKIKDIDFKRGVIRYSAPSTKARRPDEIEIAEKLMPILHRLCDGRDENELVFSDVPEWGSELNVMRKRFKQVLHSLDPPIKNASIHTWRHTTATSLVSAGVSLRVVKDILRHKNINTTMRYAHLAPDAIRGEVNRLPV